MVVTSVSRLLVIAEVSEDIRQTLPICISDNDRANELCAWLLKTGDDEWETRQGGGVSVKTGFNEAIGQLDSLLDLEFIKKRSNLNITDGFSLLFIRDATSTDTDFLGHILNELERLRPNSKPSKVSVLNIGIASDANDRVDTSFNVENTTENGSIINYQGEEWSGLIVQLAEYLTVMRNDFSDHGSVFSLGYSSIGLNMTVGRNYLAAKAKHWLLERELKEIDLDATLGNVNPLIRKHSDRFGELIRQQGHPNCEDLYGEFGRMNPSTSHIMRQYENRIKESNLLIDIDAKLQSLVDDIEGDLRDALDNVKSVTERQSLAQAVSGRFPDTVTGKPLRDWETIYELYNGPLAKLTTLGVEITELGQLDVMKESLDSAKDINHEIGECEDELYRNEQLRKPTQEIQDKLHSLKTKIKDVKLASAGASESCRANFKKVFAQVDKNLVSARVSEIIEESQYEPPPLPPPNEPVFAPWVIKRMLYTILPALVWLLLEVKWDIIHFGAAIVVFHLVILIWIIFIAKRLNRKEPEGVDVEFEIRTRYQNGCARIAELYIATRGLQKFNKLMEAKIQFMLEKEIQDLNSVIAGLSTELKRCKMYEEAAFPEISSEVSMTDRDSFDRYFDESLQEEVPEHPYLFADENRLRQHQNRNSSEAVTHFTGAIEQWAEDRSTALIGFKMFHYLVDENHTERPLFLRKDLPGVDRLIRDAKVNMTILNSAKVNSESKLHIFRYHAENEKNLIERFDRELSKEFEHATTGNLFNLDTNNPNRIGFLSIKQLN